MRHTRSVTRAIVGLLAAFVSFALLACGVAAALITVFETPPSGPGSVNGQGGRPAFPGRALSRAIPACFPTNGQYDQEVVTNSATPFPPQGFGLQSLRMSNACASSEFSHQTYSPGPLPAGEERVKKVFTAQFSFMSKTPESRTAFS